MPITLEMNEIILDGIEPVYSGLNDLIRTKFRDKNTYQLYLAYGREEQIVSELQSGDALLVESSGALNLISNETALLVSKVKIV